MGFIGILKKYLHFHISYSIILNCQEHGGIPEWPKGADCKSVGNAFGTYTPVPVRFRSTAYFRIRLIYSQGQN